MEYEDRRRIATPEGVELALPLAGIGTRFLASIVDTIIGGVGALVVILLAGWIGGEVAAAIASAAALLVFYVGYHVVFEVAGGGRTIGKRAARLRVVMDGGAPVGLRASLIRNVLRLLEGIFTSYLPAMIAVLATKHNQRIGDLLAGTIVVRELEAPAAVPGPTLPEIPAARTESWDVAGVGEPEMIAVRTFLERRWGFEPGARAALAADLASRLRPRVPGARHGLSDEEFLEHLAAAKARPDGGSVRSGS